ncbi:MAG: hypothetical protein V7603_3483 [Micromonosporaceae bacterium]
MRTGVLLGALVLVLAGCSPARHGPAGGVRLVPWDGTVPAHLRPATVAPAPACQASRLTVTGGGFRFTPGISGGTGEVTLRNTGPDACRLTGRPQVRIVGAVPAPAQRQAPLPAQPPAFPTVTPPDGTLLAVPPGAAVTLGVDWRNWCLPRTAEAPVPPRAIRLTLPGGGSIDVGYNAVPQCDTPTAATTVGVRPFQPAPLPATAPWTPGVVQATIQPLSGNGPLTGRRGDTARFAVEIRNPSAAPIPFERCPLLVEMLAPAGRPEAHQLNCRAAGQVPAGGSLRFEMRIQIPADAPAGSNGLFWQLDPTGSQGPQAVSRIDVRPS